MVAQPQEDAIIALSLAVEEVKVCLIVGEETGVAGKNEARGSGGESEAGLLLADLKMEVRQDLK